MVKSCETEVRKKQVIPANSAMYMLEGTGNQRTTEEKYGKGSLGPPRETHDTSNPSQRGGEICKELLGNNTIMYDCSQKSNTYA